jgi:predicted ABC-type ATPase
MAVPILWLVAGPNGAGKTTSVQKEPISLLLPNVSFLNPDDRTLAKLRMHGFQGFADAPFDVQTRLFLESADEVFAELESALAQQAAVGVETVLSSRKYCPLVESVRAQDGFVGLIYVALSSPVIAQERVAARVQRGGHGIPEGKISEGWRRSLEYLPWFVARASAFWIVDNSDSNPDNPPRLVASGKAGLIEYAAGPTVPEMKAALSGLPKLPPSE